MNFFKKKIVLSFISQLVHPTKNVEILSIYESEFFWNQVLKVGSNQLILPAIFEGIYRKKIQNFVPRDLIIYLEKITKLNEERNILIKNQVFFLAKIFKNNNINYVFLKGAAMLINPPYNALKERMIGDIDVLVDNNDLNKARKLLIESGFKIQKKNIKFTEKIFTEKHLQRMIHPKYIAAVELHRSLTNQIYGTKLHVNEILKSKQIQNIDICIPSRFHMWQHAILNWQYNDKGMLYNISSFRTIIDVIYLEPEDLFTKIHSYDKSIKNFYSLLSVYYHEYPVFNTFKKVLFQLQTNSKIFGKLFWLYVKICQFISIFISRLKLILFSKPYRNIFFSNFKLISVKFLDFWKKN